MWFRWFVMANDGKLGLVLGVAIVLVIAAIFFRHDTPARSAPGHPVTQIGSASLPGSGRVAPSSP